MEYTSVLALAAAFAFATAGTAQTVPDAGALRQQIEREQTTPLPRQASPLATPPAEFLKSLPGLSVTLNHIRFDGNTLLRTESLEAVVQPNLNQQQTFAQLQQAAQAVAEAYREAGWLARAYLPAQDLADGVLTIRIVEAVFSGVQREGAAPARVDSAQVQRIFQAQQAPGSFVQTLALDRALLLADDLPGVMVQATLVPGESDASTGLRLRLTDEPLVAGEASLDNTGTRSTGSERLNAAIYLNSALGVGDQAVANLTHTEGSDYLRLGFSLPLGSDGWRIGSTYSQLNYTIIAPEFAALHSQGASGSLALEANYPLLRARNRNLVLSLGHEEKSFRNESNAALQSDYRSSAIRLGLSGNAFDTLGGGGANTASLTLLSGSLALGSLQPAENAALNGSFDTLRYALSREQVLRQELSLYTALSGQQSGTPLDSSEKFTLGGANGVRAYPSNEGSGSSGQLATLELRWRLKQGYSLSGFYDWGSVRNRDSNPAYCLQGAGVSLGWQSPHGLRLQATWAHRIGDNPNPTASGSDQDGSLKSDRVWLTASLPF